MCVNLASKFNEGVDNSCGNRDTWNRVSLDVSRIAQMNAISFVPRRKSRIDIALTIHHCQQMTNK